jgi:hypothetical protein
MRAEGTQDIVWNEEEEMREEVTEEIVRNEEEEMRAEGTERVSDEEEGLGAEGNEESVLRRRRTESRS